MVEATEVGEVGEVMEEGGVVMEDGVVATAEAGVVTAEAGVDGDTMAKCVINCRR
jgi:hypothetical protein